VSTPELYPLRFRPLFQNYLWGGRRLETVLNKTLGVGEHFAESWEVVDHGEHQSVVERGPMAGKTLHQLVTDFNEPLLGSDAPRESFPLLFKFLDAHRHLSVQVHPNDVQARQLEPPDLGKTEAWVVLHADPGSVIYAGLKRGFDRDAFEREINRGTAELCLHRFEPRAGDCVLIPAGTVHALGAGLVIAEIQQSSNTTFRLFDWNRVDELGQPRPLHIAQGLAVTDFDRGPVSPLDPQPTDRPYAEQLVACDKFVVERWRVEQPVALGGDDRFRILSVLAGAIDVAGDPAGRPLEKGESLLLPAAVGPCRLEPHGACMLLVMY